MRGKAQQPGQELASLAQRQHGVVSIRQLRQRFGYSQASVERLAAAGHLHRLYQGVYAVGHTDISLHGECLAAVLASGSDALLSHYSAAWLWGLTLTQPIPVHTTGPSPRANRLPIRVHRSTTLTDTDRALVDGIPVTSVPRTLLDQAARSDPRRLKKLLKRSEERKLFDLTAVHDVLARNKGHRGRKPLQRAIALYEPPPFTRSEFEVLFYEAVLASGLPTPRVNYVIAGMELDVYWPDHGLGVELDLYETHGTRDSFEEDRIRREKLLLEGVSVTNVTGPRFDREPREVLRNLRALLAQRRPA